MTNELYHYGIKGMKWGVRRYENEDGTLTEAGKKRYNYEDRQKKQDERLYGKRAPKRIQKRLDNGETLLSARNAEVRRRDKKNKIKRGLKRVGVTTGITAVTLSPIAVSAIINKIQDKRYEKNKELYKQQLLNAYKSAWKRKGETPTRDQVDNVRNILNRSPNQARDNAKKKSEFINKFGKLLNDSANREASSKSDFERRMKEYWENGGRDKWNKKRKGQ